MRATYRIDAEHRRVCTRLHGLVTDAELLDPVERVRVERADATGFDHVIDAHEIARLDVTSSGVRRLAEGAHEEWGTIARIVLVAPTNEAFGMGRTSRTLLDAAGWQCVVVRSLADADALPAHQHGRA